MLFLFAVLISVSLASAGYPTTGVASVEVQQDGGNFAYNVKETGDYSAPAPIAIRAPIVPRVLPAERVPVVYDTPSTPLAYNRIPLGYENIPLAHRGLGYSGLGHGLSYGFPGYGTYGLSGYGTYGLPGYGGYGYGLGHYY